MGYSCYEPGDKIECLCCDKEIDTDSVVSNAYDHAVEADHVVRIETNHGQRYYIDNRGMYGIPLPKNHLRNHMQISTRKNPLFSKQQTVMQKEKHDLSAA